MYACNSICILHTIEKNTPKSKPQPSRSPKKIPPEPLLRTRFSAPQLLRQFHKLLPLSLLDGWLALCDKKFYERAFTPLITLWYLIFQRLHPNHHLSHVVEDAREGGADRLSPPGKHLSQRLRSEATTSYSDARQRLPLEVCLRALRHIVEQTHKAFQVPQKFGLKLGLIDGTTCRMRPLGDIPEHFPPHRPGNCKKPAYWCLARVVGVLCWGSGVVVDSAMASLKTSEQALCAQILSERCWQGWLLAADRNFGVYSVARVLLASLAQGLLRLTEARARKLARSAGLTLTAGLDAPIDWIPTSHDQCPAGLTRTPVPGRLIAIRVSPRGFRPFTLYLFTTLIDRVQYPASELAQIYGLRWNIELCFRYIKTQMDLGFLECHSANLIRKEWLAGLIAYNLIRWTMGAAAALDKVPVNLLSFSRARELLLGWLTRSPLHRRRSRSWKRLLTRIGKARLPKRRKTRPPEPRAIRCLAKDVAKLEGSRAAARQKLAKTNAKS